MRGPDGRHDMSSFINFVTLFFDIFSTQVFNACHFARSYIIISKEACLSKAGLHVHCSYSARPRYLANYSNRIENE